MCAFTFWVIKGVSWYDIHAVCLDVLGSCWIVDPIGKIDTYVVPIRTKNYFLIEKNDFLGSRWKQM